MLDLWILPVAVTVFVTDGLKFSAAMFIHFTIALQMTLMTGWDLMASQRALFTEMEQRLSAGEPRGFRCQEQIISEEIEASLAAELGQLDLRPFEFHGHFGNRRVVNFGLKYDLPRVSGKKLIGKLSENQIRFLRAGIPER